MATVWWHCLPGLAAPEALAYTSVAEVCQWVGCGGEGCWEVAEEQFSECTLQIPAVYQPEQVLEGARTNIHIGCPKLLDNSKLMCIDTNTRIRRIEIASCCERMY